MTEDTTDSNGIKDDDALDDTYDPSSLPVHPLACDWAIYAHYLKEADLTGEQQRQLIETLWTIASLFVDYGFGLHPVQQIDGHQVCGEDEELAALIAEDMLIWDEHSEHEHEYEENRRSPVGIDMDALPERSPR